MPEPELYFDLTVIPPETIEDIINELIVASSHIYCYDEPFICPWCSHRSGFTRDQCEKCHFNVHMKMYEDGMRRIRNVMQRLNEIRLSGGKIKP
jgi:hypothetical protein